MENEIRIISLAKKKNKYIVTTEENEYIFDEDIIVKHLIFKDKIYQKEEFKKIINEQVKSLSLQKALNYLKYGPRSEEEIKAHLQDTQAWGYIRKRLLELGYINDDYYAKTLCDYYQRANKGPLYIKQKLKEKKIDNKIIEEVLANYSVELEEEAINKLLDKEMKLLIKKPLAKQKQILIAKLHRNGFSLDLINEVLRKTKLIEQSDGELKKDYQKLLNKFRTYQISEGEKNKRMITALLAKGYSYEKIKEIFTIKDYDE